VIGVLEDGDLVVGPIPIVAIGVIHRSDAEVEATEPEARSVTASNVPNVAAAEAAAETAMLPGMIEMVVGIIAAGVVADPLAIVVNVRGFGMALFVGIVAGLFRSCV